MNTIKKIEDVIRKREDLAKRVERAEECLESKAEKLVHPVGYSQDSLRIPDHLIRPIIEQQVELLRLELAAIDKQLGAIGSLMGVASE
jgi:hypothetical protein